MLDVKLIRQDTAKVLVSLKRRKPEFSLDDFLSKDKEWRNLVSKSETIQNQLKNKSKEIGLAMKDKKDAEPIKAEVAALKDEKEALNNAKVAAENKVASIETEFNEVKNMVVTMSKPERNDKAEGELPKWKVDMMNRKKYELS